MTVGPEQVMPGEVPGGDVESPQVAVLEGGRVGAETAGREQDRDRGRAMTREEWIALQVEAAPEITPEAWRRTLRLLRASRRPQADPG